MKIFFKWALSIICISIAVAFILKPLKFRPSSSFSCRIETGAPDLADAIINIEDPLFVSTRKPGKFKNDDPFPTIYKFHNVGMETHYDFSSLPPNQKFKVVGCEGNPRSLYLIVQTEDEKEYLLSLHTLESLQTKIKNPSYELYYAADAQDYDLFEKLINSESPPPYDKRQVGKRIFRISYLERREKFLKLWEKKIGNDIRKVDRGEPIKNDLVGKVVKTENIYFYKKNLIPCNYLGKWSCGNDLNTSVVIDREIEDADGSNNSQFLSKYALTGPIRLEIIPIGTTFKIVERFAQISNGYYGKEVTYYLILEDSNGMRAEIAEDRYRYYFTDEIQKYEEKVKGKSQDDVFWLKKLDDFKANGNIKITACLQKIDRIRVKERLDSLIDDLELKDEIEFQDSECPSIIFKTLDSFSTFVYFKDNWYTNIEFGENRWK